MAVLLSFTYRRVPKDHKSEEEVWSVVHLKRQEICSESPHWMVPLAGSGLKTEGDHLKIEKLTALLFE